MEQIIFIAVALVLLSRYYSGMAEVSPLRPITLDDSSSTLQKPFGIITADNLGTREFDDGIAVTVLDADSETYRVHVFSADTSQLYQDDEVVASVMERRETKIYYGDNGRVFRREPMIDPKLARRLHLKASSGVRRALSVSFLVGQDLPPSDLRMTYGNVEVRNNYPYTKFGRLCHSGEDFQRYSRAAAYILGYIGPRYASDEQAFSELIGRPRTEAENRGRDINYAYMIAANYIGSTIMRGENRRMIYRRDNKPHASATNTIAYYSQRPGRHETLGLDVYARLSSPLRRLDDFVNHGQVHLREVGLRAGERDLAILRQALDRLSAAEVETKSTATPAA